MTPHRNATLLLFAPPPAAPTKGETGFGARLRAAFAGIRTFFARPAAPTTGEAAPGSREPRTPVALRVTQHKHLRVIHTGTRI